MEYINDLIRRKDRLLSEDEAMSLLENGEYGVLSISSPEEGVYGIPINYVWDKQPGRTLNKYNILSFS
ncbi:hypothetical protein K0F78_21265, partial [Bacteroides fragilis]|nr:hypothetical protein [Bacteroides fragilis]